MDLEVSDMEIDHAVDGAIHPWRVMLELTSPPIAREVLSDGEHDRRR